MPQFAKINGKLVELSSSRVKGSELIEYATGGNPGRRAIISDTRGVHNTRIDPHRYYRESDFRKPGGKPVEIRSMPERVKGASEIYPAGTYFKPRSDVSLKVITEQVLYLAGHLFNGQDITYNDKSGHTMVIPNYKLPRGWSPKTTSLMIIFPVEYPNLPPNGFYISKNVVAPSLHGHIYSRAYNNGYGSTPKEQQELERLGWVWYCAHVANGSWHPAKLKRISDWRHGDNLFTFFSLISEVMNSNV